VQVSDIWVYDIEVFKCNWIIVANHVESGIEQIFHNNNEKLRVWVDTAKPTMIGFNSKGYDKWIFKSIYLGANNEIVKKLNDHIISGKNGWEFPFLKMKRDPVPQVDIMDDLTGWLRLKEIEANLGMDVKESTVSFDLDRPLTKEEYLEVLAYCRHDVAATVKLYHERQDYLQSKVAVGEMCDLGPAEAMSMTNAKLTAEFLNAEMKKHADKDEYEFPENLVIENYPGAIEFFKSIDPGRRRRRTVSVAGVPHVLAYGGLHGARECCSVTKSDELKIVSIDVASYYPSLMIVNGYVSRNVPSPEEFKRVYDRRIAAKKAGDKSVSDALKLVLNTCYGAMNNQYNKLYDPRQALAVCVSGQLYLIDLIEKLETVPTFELIQSNTDGLIVTYDPDYEFDIMDVVSEWEMRTNFAMEVEEIDSIHQKDVNNYIQRSANGKIKVKGAYVNNYDGGSYKQRSLVIVAQAIVAYLLDDVSPEDTIGNCYEMWKFQQVCKAGSTYDKVIWKDFEGDHEVQSVNRVFASKDEFDGTIYKVKLSPKERWDKMANLPDHCFIDNESDGSIELVDKDFYIDMAKKRINDYLGRNEFN
jgi:hypothetical protein